MSKDPSRWLKKPAIPAMRLEPGMKVSDLVDAFQDSGSYQAGRLAAACHIYRRMLDDGAAVALTLAGAMTPTGMGGAIARMIEHGAIDWIVATGANIYHDLHFALDLNPHQGEFMVDDTALEADGVERIYDIFITEHIIYQTDYWFYEVMTPHKGKTMSTAELHNILGKALLREKVDPLNSFIAAAARYDVPVYTSSPGDSGIGLNIVNMELHDITIRLDPNRDVIETTAIVNGVDKNGVIIVGGGSPKNFYLQTQPMLDMCLGIKKGGHDYDIQITVDAPHWGGLSGATPEEAVSWGKINPEELKNSVVVYSDSTIAVPILFSYVLDQVPQKEHKRIYPRIPEMVEKMKKESSKPLYAT
jgi:deoxyhypusine synthase